MRKILEISRLAPVLINILKNMHKVSKENFQEDFVHLCCAGGIVREFSFRRYI